MTTKQAKKAAEIILQLSNMILWAFYQRVLEGNPGGSLEGTLMGNPRQRMRHPGSAYPLYVQENATEHTTRVMS